MPPPAASPPDPGPDEKQPSRLHEELFSEPSQPPSAPSPPPPASSAGERGYPLFAGDLPWSQRSWAYQFRPFRGMYYDVRRRLPLYRTDWAAAFYPRNWYTLLDSTVRMYFIKCVPFPPPSSVPLILTRVLPAPV